MTQYVTSGKGKIAYDDSGSGPLVVAIPSMGDLRGEYRFLVPQLNAAGYRVAGMDVRGHGDSSVGWEDYSVAGVGSDALALIRALDAGPATIIGESMGAGAAVWAAAEAPELVNGLVCIGPFVRGGGDFMGRVMALILARPWGAALWAGYFSNLYPSRKPADFDAYRVALRANLAQPGRLEALQAMALASKSASEVRLPKVKAPALVLMGSRDPDFKQPEVEAHWVANSLHASCEMIPGAGHYPQAEMPDVAGPRIVSFLNSLHSR